MKRFLAYCLVAVTLFIGVATTSVIRNESIKSETTLADNHTALPDQPQFSVSATDMCLSIEIGNEQVRLTNVFQQISFRTLPSCSNTLRLIRSAQLVNQKLAIGNALFLLNSSFKQLDGYYLYQLRKLLI